MGWSRACAVDELVDARPTGVRVGTQRFVLLRLGDHIFATEALCPHKFAALEDGTVENGCLVCPQHDAHFDPATGETRAGDEWAGKLHVFETRVVDGRVEIQT